MRRATPLSCIYIARAETKSRLPFLRSSLFVSLRAALCSEIEVRLLSISPCLSILPKQKLGRENYSAAPSRQYNSQCNSQCNSRTGQKSAITEFRTTWGVLISRLLPWGSSQLGGCVQVIYKSIHVESMWIQIMWFVQNWFVLRNLN